MQTHTYQKRLAQLLITFMLVVTTVQDANASTWNPTMLVNTEAFQIVDEGDASTDVELRFGDVIDERLYWDISAGRFRISDDLTQLISHEVNVTL